ncbi:hypothetical protein EIK77_002419 [Talaromyces pinophilus]|nr:hypothetical protein EIK77_002419 [Talaromyces pinophilus]
MKYTTALTVLLAFGPATTILAAPLTQDPGSALTAGPAPSGGQAAPAPGGSSSQGMSGSSTGNEGLLDKVEKIVKDVLGGSTDPDALPPTAPKDGKDDGKDDDDKKAAPAPAPAPKDDSSSSNSDLSKFLGGRSVTDQIDPINTSGTSAPISNSAVEPTEAHHLPSKPSTPVAPAPATKESAPVGVAPLDTQKQNVEESKKEKEGPNDGTPTTDPFKLTPEEIEALKTVLASQSKGESDDEGVPGLGDE